MTVEDIVMALDPGTIFAVGSREDEAPYYCNIFRDQEQGLLEKLYSKEVIGLSSLPLDKKESFILVIIDKEDFDA